MKNRTSSARSELKVKISKSTTNKRLLLPKLVEKTERKPRAENEHSQLKQKKGKCEDIRTLLPVGRPLKKFHF